MVTGKLIASRREPAFSFHLPMFRPLRGLLYLLLWFPSHGLRHGLRRYAPSGGWVGLGVFPWLAPWAKLLRPLRGLVAVFVENAVMAAAISQVDAHRRPPGDVAACPGGRGLFRSVMLLHGRFPFCTLRCVEWSPGSLSHPGGNRPSHSIYVVTPPPGASAFIARGSLPWLAPVACAVGNYASPVRGLDRVPNVISRGWWC